MKGFKECSLALALLIPFTSPAAQLAEGVLPASWLIQNCGSAIKAQGKQQVDIGTAAEAGACLGYLGGLAEISPISNQVLPARAQVCVPGLVRSADLAKVVLNYIEARPAVKGDPRLVVALAAMAAKYPCKK